MINPSVSVRRVRSPLRQGIRSVAKILRCIQDPLACLRTNLLGGVTAKNT